MKLNQENRSYLMKLNVMDEIEYRNNLTGLVLNNYEKKFRNFEKL
jgi:hypothetical protein